MKGICLKKVILQSCSTAHFRMVVKGNCSTKSIDQGCGTALFQMVVKERNIGEIKLKVAVQYTFTW